MKTKQLYITALAGLFVSSSAFAVIGPIKITLNPTELSSNYFNEDDTSAPFASEVYTLDDIKNSNATNIYDFLSQNTSLSLAASSGMQPERPVGPAGLASVNSETPSPAALSSSSFSSEPKVFRPDLHL